MEPDPPIISRITIKAVNNSCSLTVEWNPASVGNQCPIKAYTVYYREVLPDATKQRWRGELVSQPTSYRLNLKNLKCETEYEIAVTANNTKGESAKSKSMIRLTAGKIALYWQTQTQTHGHTRTHTHTHTHTHARARARAFLYQDTAKYCVAEFDQLMFSIWCTIYAGIFFHSFLSYCILQMGPKVSFPGVKLQGLLCRAFCYFSSLAS